MKSISSFFTPDNKPKKGNGLLDYFKKSPSLENHVPLKIDEKCNGNSKPSTNAINLDTSLDDFQASQQKQHEVTKSKQPSKNVTKLQTKNEKLRKVQNKEISKFKGGKENSNSHEDSITNGICKKEESMDTSPTDVTNSAAPVSEMSYEDFLTSQDDDEIIDTKNGKNDPSIIAISSDVEDGPVSDDSPILIDSCDSDAGPVPIGCYDSDAGPVHIDSCDSYAGPVPIDSCDSDAGPEHIDLSDSDAGLVLKNSCDSELSQDIFCEEIISGSSDIKATVKTTGVKPEINEGKPNLAKKYKVPNDKVQQEKVDKPPDKKKKAKDSKKLEQQSLESKPSKKKSGGKQMTITGKIINHVPKLQDSDAEEDRETSANVSLIEEAPKSKSIMNFFVKVDKKFPRVPVKPDSERLTCKAEVHGEPVKSPGHDVKTLKLEGDDSPEGDKNSSKRKSNVVVETVDMSITQLESMFITVPEKKKRLKRVEQEKRQETEQELEMTEENAGWTYRPEGTESQNKETCQTNSQNGIGLVKLEDHKIKEEETNIVDREDTSSNDAIIDKVDACVIDEECQRLRKSQLANQMACLDKIQIAASKKTLQATLNFSGRGTVIQTVSQDSAKPKLNKKQPKKNPTLKEAKSDDSDFENKSKASQKVAVKKSKKAKENVTPTKTKDAAKERPSRSPVKTPSKRVYAAKILPARRNSRPGLRMRFTTIRELSANRQKDNEEMMKLTAKMTKAQGILDKARKSRHTKGTSKTGKQKKKFKPSAKVSEKRSEKTTAEESPSLRRSSRQSSIAAKPTEIQSSTSMSKLETTTPKSGKNRKEEKTMKKKVKMAPIFSKKKTGKLAEEDSDDEVQVTKVQVDPELLRIRREFLLSGVPETLKKQAETSSSVTASEHAPWPEVSHVRQAADSLHTTGVWNLPNVTLPQLRESCDDVRPSTQAIHKGDFTQCTTPRPTSCKMENAQGADEFEEETLKYLLAEVSVKNPSFPVRRVYKQLVKKHKQALGTWVEPTVQPNEETKETTKSKKRKLNLGEEESEPPRRSKRRRAASDTTEAGRSSEDDCQIVKEPVKPEDPDKSRDIQWTEKYSPSSSAEVLGNLANSKKLKAWLEEWRQKTNLEVKKIKKQLMKEAKKDSHIKEEIEKKLGDDWWTDDESDFECDTEDDSDYEGDGLTSGLCNTMVLVGPHGIGKTAIVYALAQELGYKVFEVNASSKRAGKQMLTELQEATQSHQVGQAKMDKLFTTFKMLQEEKKKSQETPKPEKKMNPMFASFFTNKSKSKEDQQKSEKPKKRTPEPSPKGKAKASVVCGKLGSSVGPSSPKKGLHLNSTSLILFEEVDVIFEEDKGFWTAIETFMNTTKRPIILTASDSKVAACISGRHEIIKLRPSPLVNMTSYLQLVCLAEKLRTDSDDLWRLVHSCGGDLRQALLKLQFWVISGAGITKHDKPITYNPVFFNKRQEGIITPQKMTPQKSRIFSNVCDSGKDSEEEFEIRSFPRKRRHLPMVVDSGEESSNTSPVKPLRFAMLRSSQDESVAEESQDELSVQQPAEANLPVATVKGPPVQALAWYSISGPSLPKLSSSQDFIKVLGEASSIDSACRLVSWYLSHDINLIYANLPVLIDLPKTCLVPPRLPTTDKNTARKRRRIKIYNDVFDCEDSDAESNQGPKETIPQKDMEVDNSEVKDNKSDDIPTVKTADEAVTCLSVKALAGLYDALSYTDAHLTVWDNMAEGPCGHNKDYSWTSGHLTSGLTDCFRIGAHSQDYEVRCDMAAQVCVRAVHKCNSKLSQLQQHMKRLDDGAQRMASSKMCLPVPAEDVHCSYLHLTQDCPSQQRAGVCRRGALEFVSSCMPYHVHCNHRALAMDVMPYLRNICQSEQVRQVTNTRRRFMHYLDSTSIGISRKQSVLDTLCSSFT